MADFQDEAVVPVVSSIVLAGQPARKRLVGACSLDSAPTNSPVQIQHPGLAGHGALTAVSGASSGLPGLKAPGGAVVDIVPAGNYGNDRNIASGGLSGLSGLKAAIRTLIHLFVLAAILAAPCPMCLGATITSGETQTGTIAATEQTDIFLFTASAGDSLAVKLAVTSGTFAPRITLYGPDGSRLTSGSGSPSAFISHRAPATGTYSLSIQDSSWRGNGTGDYELRLARFPGAADADGGEILSGQTRTGTIDLGDLDVFTLSALVGENLTLRLAVTSGTISPTITFYGPDGSRLASGSGAPSTSVNYRAPSNGTYFLLIQDSSWQGNGTGDYELRLAKFPGAADADGGEILSGQTRTGTIDLGDLDVFTLSASVGENFTLRLAVTSGTISPTITLFGPDGKQLTSDSGSPMATVSYRAPATGTYSLSIQDSSWQGNGTGDYELRLAKFPGAADADGGEILSGQTRTGTIDLGDLDVFTLSASVGENLTLRLAVTSGTISPTITLYGPDGIQLTSDSGSPMATVSYRAPKTGTYSLLVQDRSWQGNGTGDYQLRMAKFPGAVDADGGEITSGQTRNGTIDLGDLDVCTFNASVGDNFSLRLAVTSGTLSPTITLYGPDGIQLRSDSGSPVATVSYRAPTTGTYSLLVQDRSWQGNGTGDYQLRMAKFPGAVDADGGEITSGQTKTGNIGLGDLDVFTVSASVGENFTLRLAVASGTLSPSITLYGPDGNQLTLSSGSPSTSVSYRAPSTGAYSLLIQDNSWLGNGTGDYELRLAKFPGAVDADGGQITSGQTEMGTIDLGDLDTFTFNASIGDNLTINLVVTSGTFTPSLELYGPDGSRLGSGWGSSPTTISRVAQSAGNYFILLQDNSWLGAGTGAYKVSMSGAHSTLPPPQPGPPTLLIPGDSSAPGPVLNTLTPTFAWSAVRDATSYGLYIRDMTAAGTPLVFPNADGTTTTPLAGTSYALPEGYLVRGRSYRWEMTSFVGSSESSQSGVLYFQTPVSAPVLSVIPTQVSLSADVGTMSFTVSNVGGSDMVYSAVVSSESSWLRILSGSSGGNSGMITVSYEANPGAERTGTIIVSTANGALASPLQLTVSQAAASGRASFTPGDRVMAKVTGANARNLQLDDPPLFIQVGGVHGTLVGGPVNGTAGGYTGNWWQITWDSAPPDQSQRSVFSAESVIALGPPAGDVPQPDFSARFYAPVNGDNDASDNIFVKSGQAPTATPLAVDFNASALGNCTWYASGRMLELGHDPAQLAKLAGHASEWAAQSHANKFPVDPTPSVHAIAQLNSKDGFSHGHVAVVESVNGDGTITVTESAYSTDASSPWNFLWRHRTVATNWFDNFVRVALKPVPPVLVSPGDPAAPGPGINTLSPTFTWNHASNATGYGLYIRDMTAVGTPLVFPNADGTTTTPLTGTSYGLPAGYLVRGHAYRWGMTSFVGSSESAQSSILYFQVTAANDVAEIAFTTLDFSFRVGTPVKLEGIVRDSSGKGVGNIQLYAEDSIYRQSRLLTTTDVNGAFQIDYSAEVTGSVGAGVYPIVVVVGDERTVLSVNLVNDDSTSVFPSTALSFSVGVVGSPNNLTPDTTVFSPRVAGSTIPVAASSQILDSSMKLAGEAGKLILEAGGSFGSKPVNQAVFITSVAACFSSNPACGVLLGYTAKGIAQEITLGAVNDLINLTEWSESDKESAKQFANLADLGLAVFQLKATGGFENDISVFATAFEVIDASGEAVRSPDGAISGLHLIGMGADGSERGYALRKLPSTYPVTLTASPETGGSVSSSPSPDASGQYPRDSTLSLIATPADGYYLQSWSGVDSFDGNTAQVTMSGPRAVTANFTSMAGTDTGCGCATECLTEGVQASASVKTNVRRALSSPPPAPRADPIDLSLIRAFRDQVLARSREGQALIDTFYKASPEIIYHYATTPGLRSVATDAIVSLQPVLEDMTSGTGELVLSSNQIGSVNSLIAKLNDIGGVELKSAIGQQLARVGTLDNLAGRRSAEARKIAFGVSLHIVNPRISADGRLEFTLTGVLLPGTLRVEFSDELTKWLPLDVPPITTLPATLRDDQALSAKQRYYRVVVTP